MTARTIESSRANAWADEFWCGRPWRLSLLIFALLAIEVIALQIIQWHEYFMFRQYVALDQGSVLTANHLVSSNLRPGVDFGYTYGLLPLLIGRIFFSLIGETPQAYALAITLLQVAIFAGLIRIVAHLSLRFTGLLLVSLILPLIVTRYDNLAYALEAALLTNGFAEQFRGRYNSAFGLAVCSALSKPAIGFIYAALVLFFLFRDQALHKKNLFASLAPTLIVIVSVVSILAFTFGIESFWRTIVPIQGIELYYSTSALGFHLRELRFLSPPHTEWRFYLGTYAAFWLAALLWILVCSTSLSLRLIKGTNSAVDELMITVGALVVSDFFLLSVHYLYLIPVGAIVALGAAHFWGRCATWVLCLAALPAFFSTVNREVRFTHADSGISMINGLWIEPDLRAEWEAAGQFAVPGRTVTLAEMGGGGLVMPGLEKPVGAYFLPGTSLPADLAREHEQLADCETIILFHRLSTDASGTVLDTFPELKRAIPNSHIVYQGKYLEVRLNNLAHKALP